MTAAFYLPLVSLLSSLNHPAPKVEPPLTAVVNVCDVQIQRQVEEATAAYTLKARWDLVSRERCEYLAEGGRITIRSGHSTQPLSAKFEFSALKQAFPDARAREVSSIGAPALVLDLPDSGTQVFALTGEHDYLMVSILGFGDSSHISQTAERLARAALRAWIG
jgi:hypothetical protein